MNAVRLLAIVAAVAVGVTTGPLAAQTPLGTEFTYQGRLADGGNPANGAYDIQFTLYDQLSGGTQQGPTVCVDNVAVAEGLFTATLDFGDQFPGQERFLEVAIRVDAGQNCANTSGFTTLSPRQKLTATPNALNAEKLDGLDSTAFLQAVPNPLTLSGSAAGSHIILGENTSTAAASTGVSGRSTAASGTTYGGNFQSASTSGRGVLGHVSAATGSTYGLYGSADSTSGKGVYGLATADSGTTYGGYFQSNSTSGYGIFAKALGFSGSTYGGWFETRSPSGEGVHVLASATSGYTYGGYFDNDSTEGTGVYAHVMATSGNTLGVFARTNSPDGISIAGTSSGIGVQGYCWGTSGIGVRGVAAQSTGTTNGVLGEAYSTSGRGVMGVASATTGSTFGGYFESSSSSGYGVYRRNGATSGTIYGVRGYASTAAGGYAVYAAGDMGASGTKSFRIDHPVDPGNKYLLHYSAESPEVLNFYSGNVTLDERGEEVVELPDYFASINTDPRYTLTAVGAPMPDLHVAEEISEEALAAGEQAGPGMAPPICWFRIAGGVPGGKVSWRIEALRNDLRMRLHGAPVERDKTGPERGKYQHPEYYGQPAEMGMDYRLDDAGLEPGSASPATVPNVTEQD